MNEIIASPKKKCRWCSHPDVKTFCCEKHEKIYNLLRSNIMMESMKPKRIFSDEDQKKYNKIIGSLMGKR